jgi:ABC-type nitrate/sulfonate/bicarbonate transport system permease component
MRAFGDMGQRFLLGLIGVGLFLGLWQVIGELKLAGLTWPPLTTVLAFLFDPAKRALMVRATLATFSSVALGYIGGALGGIAVAMLGHVVIGLRPGIDRLVALIHAIPLIALGPLFMVTIERNSTAAAISGLGVFYLIYVATTSGFSASSPGHNDLFRVFGSSPLTRFWRLDLPAAMPSVVSGLKLAIPVAFIGGIVGEWFGASRGLGLLMVSAMQNFQIPLLWSAVLVTTVTSLALFGLMSIVERFVKARFQ